MTPNILDLRQERCPMALLLAKRHSVKLEVGQSLSIYVSDNSSMKDIVTFLSKQAYDVIVEVCSNYYHLLVTKKELQSNA
ncbi:MULTISPECIES: sulfurtransferase TusA family protein [Vibrio]|uniref:Oxidoreductase n=1 Tax=Vibrio tasmaniensis TaxID=212663 RepID=A0A2N7NIW1_9VIBR|nr:MULTISPECIES: sulfurtransferase TusA family protein [Vibrio]EAQ53440.1 Predicted redox protein [Vibrio sp. MED222]PMP14852.1 oxidoreductase [Vibrio tasmaniensis]TKG35994.1 sulfurtransferase TusA family protein [Vibrio tasmaniensis]TKG42685.1 sulfurtransferase TusA family protein [Vibrio tasmaniensis]TKG49109.1 sulfurtransferase TusA family protein [Vibrio tasmaniensis]